MSEAQEATNDALNNAASLREEVSVAGTCEAVLLSNALTASSRMSRATAELSQARGCDLNAEQGVVRGRAAEVIYKRCEE